MDRHERSVAYAFLGVCAVYGGFFLAYKGYRAWMLPVRLDTVAPAYYHYDFIEIRLRARDAALKESWRERRLPRAAVLRNGKPVETIAGITWVPLAWDEERSAFIGRWPCPWNAPDGEYALGLGEGPELGGRLKAGTFLIKRRTPVPLPRRFVVLDLESVSPLGSMRVRAPDGSLKGWRGMLDWAQYVGADAFWMLLGQTPGEKPGEKWVAANLPLIPLVAEECRRRGIKFGIYVESFLTMSSSNRIPGYEYALDMDNGRVKVTRAISIRDSRRPKDVAELLKRYRDVPGVDYLGLDYIRNALGGYELIDDFYADMPGVRPPSGWDHLTREERMTWFIRKKVMRKDFRFIDAWQWWRAHRVALIVKGIKAELGDAKPLWAFTLTWDRGWQHGQDPVMMNDAGVDADALMLYEADSRQFDRMMQDWHSYLSGSDVQLVVGDVVDWPLHQRSRKGPGEFRDRLVRAIDGIYGDGAPAKGVFFHDVARALWGRLGPYTTRQWMDEARRVSRYFRNERS